MVSDGDGGWCCQRPDLCDKNSWQDLTAPPDAELPSYPVAWLARGNLQVVTRARLPAFADQANLSEGARWDLLAAHPLHQGAILSGHDMQCFRDPDTGLLSRILGLLRELPVPLAPNPLRAVPPPQCPRGAPPRGHWYGWVVGWCPRKGGPPDLTRPDHDECVGRIHCPALFPLFPRDLPTHASEFASPGLVTRSFHLVVTFELRNSNCGWIAVSVAEGIPGLYPGNRIPGRWRILIDDLAPLPYTRCTSQVPAASSSRATDTSSLPVTGGRRKRTRARSGDSRPPAAPAVARSVALAARSQDPDDSRKVPRRSKEGIAAILRRYTSHPETAIDLLARISRRQASRPFTIASLQQMLLPWLGEERLRAPLRQGICTPAGLHLKLLLSTPSSCLSGGAAAWNALSTIVLRPDRRGLFFYLRAGRGLLP